VRTLWDLLKPARSNQSPPPPARAHPRSAISATADAPARARRSAERRREHPTMAERYERMTREMLSRYAVRVRKWRSSMSGVAWEVIYEDGRVSRLIEAPRPKGPVSAAIFLHEIGHHAIGFGRYKPRCLEEYHAWAFAIDQMHAHGLNVTAPVHRRMRESLQYAVWKARRRGIRRIPPELLPFLDDESTPAEPGAPMAKERR